MTHTYMKLIMNAKRDGNIAKSATQELDLSTKVIKSKKVYSRKEKHKKDAHEN